MLRTPAAIAALASMPARICRLAQFQPVNPRCRCTAAQQQPSWRFNCCCSRCRQSHKAAALDRRDLQAASPHSTMRGQKPAGDNAMILYLVSKGANPDAISKAGVTVADMANGPRQRIQPYPETVALLEMLGSKNSHKCVSC